MSERAELRECPFCGVKPKRGETLGFDDGVWCETEGCPIAESECDFDAAAWNRRTAPAAVPGGELREALRVAIQWIETDGAQIGWNVDRLRAALPALETPSHD